MKGKQIPIRVKFNYLYKHNANPKSYVYPILQITLHDVTLKKS